MTKLQGDKQKKCKHEYRFLQYDSGMEQKYTLQGRVGWRTFYCVKCLETKTV